MNRDHPRHGRTGPPGETSRLNFAAHSRAANRVAFTLLEMCVVLLIIALLAGLSMPAVQSALTEQAIRKDTHQLALMVKTAMIQSAEQHRAYIIELSSTGMALHPVGESAVDPDASATGNNEDVPANATSMDDVEVTSSLDSPNKLMAPDPSKADGWIPMPETDWVFEPGELCPATTVRLARGDAWLQMSFSALTGNVEKETYSLP